MSQLRERTLEMIERLPEDKVIRVFNIIKDIDDPLFSEPERPPQDKMAKLASLFGSIQDGSFRHPDQLSYQERVEIAKSLFGILPQTMTFDEVMEERVQEL